MHQVPRTEIQTGDMRVGAVRIRKSRKSDSAESGYANIVVMIEAVKQFHVVGNVHVGANTAHMFVDRHSERTRELREWDHIGGVLPLLRDLLVLGFPEPAVLKERSTQAAAVVVAAKRRFGRIDQTKRSCAGGEILSPEKFKSR